MSATTQISEKSHSQQHSESQVQVCDHIRLGDFGYLTITDPVYGVVFAGSVRIISIDGTTLTFREDCKVNRHAGHTPAVFSITPNGVVGDASLQYAYRHDGGVC